LRGAAISNRSAHLRLRIRSTNNEAILPALVREKLAPNSNVERARVTEDQSNLQVTLQP